MKICIPVEADAGLKAKVTTHFGSAPYFLIYDTGREAYEIIGNNDVHHAHGICHPLTTLGNRGIDAIVCRGMGARAVQRLNKDGTRAYRADAETAEEAIRGHKKGILEEITVRTACTDHRCG